MGRPLSMSQFEYAGCESDQDLPAKASAEVVGGYVNNFAGTYAALHVAIRIRIGATRLNEVR